jgi:hypothetical protein
MSIFTLDWFKSKYKKELEKLKIEEQSLKNTLLKAEVGDSKEKPYRKLKMVNDVLTVVLRNGEIISKIPATVDDFNKAKESNTESDVLEVFLEKSTLNEIIDQKREQEKIIKIGNKISLFNKTTDFETRDSSIYLKGINRSLPTVLVGEILSIISSHLDENGELKSTIYEDNEYVSLKRFFMWCCLNPRAEVADSLYEFLVKNSFRITRQGFFVALRNVVSLEVDNGSNLKVQFISNSYNKIKAVWKKNPDDYRVVELKDGELTIEKVGSVPKGTILGNLKSLYIDLPNMMENRFTDDWTKTFDIRIGKIVSMPMEKCNWSTQDCAASGLHFTSDEINYVGCGDTSVLMLINPMKVVGIGEKKGRCYEYLPIMTVPREEATEILHDLDFDTIDLDEFYVEDQLDALMDKTQEGFSQEAKKYEFNLSPISSGEIGKIVKNLKSIKDELRKRVQEVV